MNSSCIYVSAAWMGEGFPVDFLSMRSEKKERLTCLSGANRYLRTTRSMKLSALRSSRNSSELSEEEMFGCA